MGVTASNTVIIPKQMHFADLVRINKMLWSIDSKKIYIDFKEYTHSSIFDLTFLAHQMRQIQFKRSVQVTAINNEHMGWAAGMNFFSISGSDWARNLPVNSGDHLNYIPITLIKIPKGGLQSLAEMNEEIDRQAAELSCVFLHVGSGPAFDTMQYTFREIIRNIFEHSGAKQFLLSGQYYPKHRNVQIVVCDDGGGIPYCLRFNKAFEKLNDMEALNMAMMPGVSGNQAALSKERTSPWQNSGYGLYMVGRIARNKGLLTIISGNAGIHINNTENIVESKKNFKIDNFFGTIIRIGVELTDEKLADRLQKWAEEGRALARDIAGAKQIDASTASLLLRRDFVTLK